MVPVPVALKVSRGFLGISRKICKAFPGLELDLKQADFGLKIYEYNSLMVLSGLSTFLFSLVLLIPVLALLGQLTSVTLLIALLSSVVIGLVPFIYLSKYPALIIKEKYLQSNATFCLQSAT